MKQILPILAAVGAVGLGDQARAQSAEVGPYVRGALGAAFVSNVTVNQFYSVSGSSMNLDTGIRFDVDVGYNFNQYVAAEMEFGWTYNSISSISGVYVNGASYSNFPFLANLVLQYPLAGGRLIPYIGGGAGGSVGSVDADAISDGFITITGSDTAIAFAYQGFAGIRYAFTDKMSVGLSYKYLGTGATSYYEGPGNPFGPTGKLGLGTTATQSIQATFTYRF